MNRGVCVERGCFKPAWARRLCRLHYDRLRAKGLPIESKEERFWSRVEKTECCWLWTGATSGQGYGVFTFRRVRTLAHRMAYELLVGPIQDGREIDHVRGNGCTSTLCCKAIADEYGPAHLEAVTHRENILRGVSPAAQRARQTHCKNGHEFTPENTVMSHGKWRACRQCKHATDALYRAAKRIVGA